MPIKMDLKPARQGKEQPQQITDSVDIRSSSSAGESSEVDSTQTKTDFTIHNNMESVKSMIDSCISNTRNTSGKMNSVERSVNFAKSDLSSTMFPLMNAKNDTKDKDVSSEGYTLKNYISSAERNLESGNREDRDADYSMDGIKRDINKIKDKLEQISSDLNSTDHSASAKHIKSAIQKITNSQNEAFRGDSEIDKTGREIESGLGELRFGEMFISDIQFDRLGQDVSFSARMLSSRIDDAKWKTDTADSSARNAQNSLDTLVSSLESAKQAVSMAQTSLPK